ncbi:hypothetical protein BaRGS_00006082 [Batillaria attramentaria]|uniref:Uncharacterized protein n=1 Tax=Batillaria attramentaria TaxID=370345 RepID=A0ABD0LTM9_9CAEN
MPVANAEPTRRDLMRSRRSSQWESWDGASLWTARLLPTARTKYKTVTYRLGGPSYRSDTNPPPRSPFVEINACVDRGTGGGPLAQGARQTDPREFLMKMHEK